MRNLKSFVSEERGPAVFVRTPRAFHLLHFSWTGLRSESKQITRVVQHAWYVSRLKLSPTIILMSYIFVDGYIGGGRSGGPITSHGQNYPLHNPVTARGLEDERVRLRRMKDQADMEVDEGEVRGHPFC